jgi:DNA-binding NarL/FixJ family response regulator
VDETWNDQLATLHQAVAAADDEAKRARQARDDYIRQLVAEGVTAYRIAKNLGLSKNAVVKIVRA